MNLIAATKAARPVIRSLQSFLDAQRRVDSLDALCDDVLVELAEEERSFPELTVSSALGRSFVFSFVLLSRWFEGSCDVHWRSLHSAHANFTINAAFALRR
jgi:hypothetical protein